MAGANVPLVSVEHQYMVTEPIPGVASNLPTLRDPDRLTYYKEEVGGLVMGGYEPNPIPWAVDGFPKGVSFHLLQSDFDHFEQLMELALGRVPALETAGVKQLINGPESFTPDGNFILGETPEVRGFFVGAGFNAFGIAAGGGAGKALAQWIIEGRPPYDLWPVDILRFGRNHQDVQWVRERTLEAYGKHYTIAWPHEEHRSGRPLRRSPLYGLLLSQGGEFGFVLFAAAQSALLVTPEAASLFSAIVTLSMASTPFLMMFNNWMEKRASLRGGDGLDGPELSDESRAIVVGYGRFGQTVAQMLMAKGIALTLIDSKSSQIELSGNFGAKVYYGDGTRLDLLRAAGAETAKQILFCIDGDDLSPRKLQPILEAFPHAQVFVRAFDRRHMIQLSALDLQCSIREVFESSVLMGREALLGFKFTDEEVNRVEREFRSRDQQRLESQSATGDLHQREHLLFRPDRSLADEEAPG